MKRKFSSVLLVLMAVLMVFTGCNPAPSNNGSVKIYLSDASSKAINPDGADSWAGLGVDSYELVISSGESTVYSKSYDVLPSEAVELSLPVGKYDFAANAKSGENIVAKAEQKDVIVSSRNNAQVSLVIDAFGTGNVEVGFAYAEGSVSNGAVTATLTNLATKAVIEMAVSEDKIVAEDVAVGSYILEMVAPVKLEATELTGEAEGIFIKSDIVYVENGKTSSANWTVKYEGNKASISIDSNVGEPVSFDIQVTSDNAEFDEESGTYYIPVDSNVTLKAVGDNIEDFSFEWTFDGRVTEGAEITISYDSYDLGKLSLLVTAKEGSTYGYGYKAWTVESTDFVNGIYYVGSVARLEKFSDEVYAGNPLFVRGNIVLDADLDLEGSESNPWTPIRGQSTYNGFAGTFDGNGHKISNLYVENEECAGLFATMHSGTVKNLTIENATLKSSHYAGAVVAWAESGSEIVVVDNCKVVNADILLVPNAVGDGYDNGDKAGGIIGFNYRTRVTNCSVENTKVRAYRDIGGIAGYAKGSTITGNTISNVILTSDQATNYYGDKDANVNSILGRDGSGNTLENNSGEAEIFTISSDNKTSFGNIEDNAIVNVPVGKYGSLPSFTAKNVTIICEEGTVFEGKSGISGENATIKNATFSDSVTSLSGNLNNTKFENCTFLGEEAVRWAIAYGDIVFENCTFGDENCKRGVHFDAGDGTITFNNCTIYGFTALGHTIKKVTFNDCKFPYNNIYNVVNMYSNFEFNNCEFNPSMNCDCAGNGVVATFNDCSYTDGSDIYSLVRHDKDPSTSTIKINGKYVVEGKNSLNKFVGLDEKNIDIVLVKDATINANDAYLKLGGENTESITISGSDSETLTLETTYWSRLNTANEEAKLVLKNLNLASSQENGTWNSYDITFNCNVELENVNSLKAIALDSVENASFKNVSITETHDYYALWISSSCEKVDIDNLNVVSAGRGIKIDDEYVDSVDKNKVVLDIKNSSFDTAKKGAILVKNEKGAVITVDNVDISSVAADSVNAVWVDEDAADTNDLVIVTGCTKKIEGQNFGMNSEGQYVADSNDADPIGAIFDYAKSLEEVKIEIAIPEGEIDLPSNALSSDNNHHEVVITGAGVDETTINGAANPYGDAGKPGNYAHGQDLYFKDLTFETIANGYQGGFGHANSVTFENCKIVGQFYCHSGAPHKFINCEIDPLNGYLYTYASDCVFINCTFTASKGKALQVYEDATVGENDVLIDGCDFIAAMQATTWDGKPVTPIDINSNGAKFNVTIKDCTTTGFPKGLNSDSDLWNVKTTSLDVYHVTVNGKQVYPYYTVDSSTGAFIVDTANGLSSALVDAGSAGAGSTVINITEDIDLTGKTWTPINVDGYHGADIVTLDGGEEGITIKGLTSALFKGGFAGGSGIVIKNITIEDSTIIADNDQGYGAFVCTADSMDEITLINCHLKNSTIITPNDGANESRIGGLVGWTAGYDNQNDGPVDSYITIEDCSVVGCKIKGAGSIGGIVGHAGANAATYTTIKNCTVKDNELISTDDGGWRVGVVVGTANNGQCDIYNITESGNVISQTGKTAPAGQSNLYGRFVPAETGTLTIDGVAIN